MHWPGSWIGAATFFATPAEFRAWLEAHHAQASELWVGFHKKGSGLPSMTWPEAVDEALCFGWIDGVRKSIDETSYVIRFTPRQTRSIWSAVNIGRVPELRAAGRMRPAGLKAFAERTDDKSGVYSYEQRRRNRARRQPTGRSSAPIRGVGVLPDSGGLVSQGGDLVGGQR